ncbi:hypothetical protein Tco_1420541 [Tanacetum coccineum]
MHTYVSRLKDTELETLIATYDIPLYLRPRLPDPNFRMINLLVGDTAIGIYSRIFDSLGVRIPFSSFLLAVLKYFKVHISQLVPLGVSKVITFEGDWFSFVKRGDPAPMCMEVAKSWLKLWKEKFFLIDRRAIPFHMPWIHPDSCITDNVPTSFNQSYVDQLKAHIVKLCDISEGVLLRSGLSRVLRNPMCDPVLRRSANTVMSIYDFLCMPSLDKVTVREEPHGLNTSILGRVADRTTSPAPVGTVVPRASQRKSPLPVLIARSNKKGSGAGSSGQAAGNEVEQTDDGTLDDDDQRDGSEFAMDGVSEDASPPTQEVVPAPNTQPLDAGTGADEIASDGDVDPYYKARVGNTAGDVIERDLLPFVPGPYYIPYPYEEGSGSETALDRFPTPAETYRLKELSSVKLSDRMSFTVHANEEVSRLTAELGVLKSRCQTAEHKLSSWDKKHRKYRNERDILAMEKAKIEEELIGTKSQLDHYERQAEEIQGSIASFFQSDFTPLVQRFLKSDIARLEPGRLTSSHHTSSATASLRANTHARHSTSSSGTFGHTSTSEHLKKKKKSVEKGGPSAA